MGRLIDADALKEEWKEGFHKKIVEALLDDAPTVEAIPKADYEARLKAMLKELLKEVEGLCIDNILSEDEEDINRGIEMAADVIQAKINELKAESEDKE